MYIKELMQIISGELLTNKIPDLSVKVQNVYICDLLSWVMSHAQKGDAWITVLTNVNVPAVALMTEVACVIIPEAIKAEELTLKKANENGIIIIGTQLNSFEISRRIIDSKLLS
ncbi:DRTGG domain-containing protein [Ruminiclostridium cellobioparum]|uniref:DRTGG domain-containing protein n=1 Tax=Ruminiclostridium cellobioparum subsp. termitidis CT1112 TaxID=1195236 RepID=S0FQM2_RUMCE|nr:DRTGG domain-containing protein [Ruminiclostridium cellobioparum]EMS71464.1 DRTGG domain-containing protein [Ruminiclostridium cellobioparum subsp. termitidis CT1112]